MATGPMPTACMPLPARLADSTADTATLDGTGTASTIGLDMPIVLSTLNLGISGTMAGYTIAGSGSNTLTSGSIVVTSGTHSISAPIMLAGSLAVSMTGGASLQLGDVSESPPGAVLTLSGNGQLILSGSGSYTGGTTVSSGTLVRGEPHRAVRRFELDRRQQRRRSPSLARRADRHARRRRRGLARHDVGGGSRTGNAGALGRSGHGSRAWRLAEEGIVATSNQLTVGWVEHGRPPHGALCEPLQNSKTRSRGFDSVHNPPFPARFAPRTPRSSNQHCRQKTGPDMHRVGVIYTPKYPRKSGLFGGTIVDFADVFCSNQTYRWLIVGT